MAFVGVENPKIFVPITCWAIKLDEGKLLKEELLEGKFLSKAKVGAFNSIHRCSCGKWMNPFTSCKGW